MTRHRTTAMFTVALSVALIPLLIAPAASARWNIHNSATVTQMTAPAGGTEDQTCPDRLVGETGWATFLSPEEDPATFVPDPGLGAYDPVTYDVWKAPTGFTTFGAAQAEFDPVTFELTGFTFVDETGAPHSATKVTQFVTTALTPLQPPALIDGDGDPSDGGLYVFTTAPISVSLPPSVAPGDTLGLLPTGGGSTVLDLSVIDCTPFAVAATSIRAVKMRPFTAPVATFTGPGIASDYTATINWGDRNTTSLGTISANTHGFVVTGTHTYKKKGNYPVVVTITHTSTNTTLQTHSTATVTNKR